MLIAAIQNAGTLATMAMLAAAVLAGYIIHVIELFVREHPIK